VCFGQLLLATLVLMLFGAATISALQRGCKRFELSTVAMHTSGVSLALISIVVGQLACMTWVFVRSGISGVSYALSGIQLPITLVEVLFVSVALILPYLRTQVGGLRRGQSRRSPSQISGSVIATVVVLVCAFLPLALRELPRTIALSSDPDQHAYYAHQIIRLGVIPWEQGIFGIEAFGYPAGFAVLNAVWMLCSGLSAVEVVTVQPMIQCMLALLLCGAVAPRRLFALRLSNPMVCTDRIAVSTCLILIVCYWFILPFGNQANRYLGSGTARLSTSTLSSIVLLGWILFPAKGLPSYSKRIQVAVFALITALLATFNPMSALLPFLITCLTASLLWIEIFMRQRGEVRESAITRWLSFGLCLVPLFLVFCDPYFMQPLAKSVRVIFFAGPPSPSGSASIGWFSHVSLPSQAVWARLNLGQVIRLFLAGTDGGLTGSHTATFLMLAAAATWILVFPAQAKRLAVVVVVILFSMWLAEGLTLSGSQDTPLYLVQPYIMQSLWDSGVVLGALFVMGLVGSVYVLLASPGAELALGVAVTLSLLPSRSIAQLNSELSLAPRVGMCGSFGCVAPSDVETIKFVKSFGEEILRRYSDLDFVRAPKILILGHPAIHGPEKWIFPYGASRIISLASPLPVAFFYGQGSKEWSYENYMQRVCSQLDRDWLRARNIRYLFLPESNPGCLRGKERVLGEMKVLFESGASRFLQIIPDNGAQEG
jgi:hypothetical protein